MPFKGIIRDFNFKKITIYNDELFEAIKYFGVTIILNKNVMVIEIKHCQLKNILIKLHHT